MADERAPRPKSRSAAQARSAAAPVRCSWCSAETPAAAIACPACGASLVSTAEGSLPGVTAIDAHALLRSRNAPKPRGGLLGFLSGDADGVEVPSQAELESLVPPPVAVRTEILRLELEAERQRIEAKAAAMAAEASDDNLAGSPPQTPGGGSELPPA